MSSAPREVRVLTLQLGFCCKLQVFDAAELVRSRGGGYSPAAIVGAKVSSTSTSKSFWMVRGLIRPDCERSTRSPRSTERAR